MLNNSIDWKNTRHRSLPARWFKISGQDVVNFLSGMWTADVKRAASGARSLDRPCGGHSFFLDPKAKVISQFTFLYEPKQNNVFVRAPHMGFEEFCKRLEHYVISEDVVIEELNDNRFTQAILVVGIPTTTERVMPKVSTARDQIVVATEQQGALCFDRSDFSTPVVEVWLDQENSSQLQKANKLMDDAWKELRVSDGVAEWGVDLQPNALVLEYPYADAISFEKGCYLGQEVVARATYRGKVPEGFAKVQSNDKLEPGSYFVEIDNTPTKVLELTTTVGGLGLGKLRKTYFQESKGPWKLDSSEKQNSVVIEEFQLCV